MMRATAALVGISFALSVSALSNTKYPHRVQFLHAPHPNYPKGHTGLHGSGLYRIHFDPHTGWATSVDILKSTRSNFLDQAAIEAFMKWQLAPGALHQITVPMSFGE
jgi:TonB family protein